MREMYGSGQEQMLVLALQEHSHLVTTPGASLWAVNAVMGYLIGCSEHPSQDWSEDGGPSTCIVSQIAGP